jgi:hypothetical protein
MVILKYAKLRRIEFYTILNYRNGKSKRFKPISIHQTSTGNDAYYQNRRIGIVTAVERKSAADM